MRRDEAALCPDDAEQNTEVENVYVRKPFVSTITIDEIVQGPGAVANSLCCAAMLNNDQRKLSNLFAWPMQKEWVRMLTANPDHATEVKQM